MNNVNYYIFKPLYSTYSLVRDTSNFPYQLNIELTNLCNLRCISCPYGQMKRLKGNMDYELFKKIVNEIKNYKVNNVWLHLFGDPLLHPEISKFIEYIKKNTSINDVGFSTNCVLLNKEVSLKIINSGLDKIRMCLDGISKDTYEKIRIHSDFDKVVSNITDFLKLRNEIGKETPRVELQIIYMKNTKEEIEEFKKKWLPLLKEKDTLHVQKFINFGGQVDNLSTTRKKWVNKLPCLRLWNSLSICWDGKVTACCYDSDCKLFVGDLSTNTIKDIWNGNKMNQLKEMHLKGESNKLPLCAECIRQTI